MSEFREDDQAGDDVMQAFWNSPLGREWIKENQKAYNERSEKKAMAVGMLIPIDKNTIKLERFDKDK